VSYAERLVNHTRKTASKNDNIRGQLVGKGRYGEIGRGLCDHGQAKPTRALPGSDSWRPSDQTRSNTHGNDPFVNCTDNAWFDPFGWYLCMNSMRRSFGFVLRWIPTGIALGRRLVFELLLCASISFRDSPVVLHSQDCAT